MDPTLFSQAYQVAAKHFSDAQAAVLKQISESHPHLDLDTLLHVCNSAMSLHLAGRELASRVAEQGLSYEKAVAAITAKFPEFPPEVCRSALSRAVTQLR